MSHIRRLIDTASMRRGRKIRSVRLDQEAVLRHGGGDAAQLVGVLEGEDPREGDIEPEIDADPGQLGPGGEAVQDGVEAPSPALVCQNVDHLVVSLAGVDDEWQAALPRGGDMGAKDTALHVARTAVVVEVEPGLADGDAARMGR